MAGLRKYWKFLSLPALLLAGACGDTEETRNPSDDTDLEVIKVSRLSRAEAPGMEDLAVGEAEAIVKNEFNPDDILYISQMGSSVDPSFNEGASNLYTYQYYKNDEASWDEGFNFKVFGNNPLRWSAVRELGSAGNAFAFYGMFFPGNEVAFNVKTDQTGAPEDPYNPINFNNSDILGAYHATSALYTRLRFNLFHLMVYLKVTIYVPDFTDDYNPEEDFQYSGFKEGAMKAAYMLNTDTSFAIEWRAERSSDTEAPLTQNNGTKTNIKMYMHEPDEEIIKDFKVSDYYNGGEIITDKVRAYNFSVLFPAQPFNQNSNIICFVLQKPIQGQGTGSDTYYYFSSNQLMSLSTDFALNQGTLQQLYLYLPRSTNKTILIGAKILDWGNTSTEMTVIPTDSESGQYDAD